LLNGNSNNYVGSIKFYVHIFYCYDIYTVAFVTKMSEF